MKTKNNYTDEFRENIVKLALNGKPVSEIVNEYGMVKSTVSTWINKYNATGSFRDSDNKSDNEKELIALKKNKQLRMENDILKQAAL